MRRLFFDIETSPNIMFSWRCGSKIFLDRENIIKERAIICICYKWEGEKRVHALKWDEGDDKEMLREFSLVLSRADEAIGHNVDKFDMPWVRTRLLLNGLVPQAMPSTYDTLKIARKYLYLNSARLDYLGKMLFGEGKIRTEFNLWKRIVLDNDPAAMRKMVRYCRQDVRLLERVWGELCDYQAPSVHAAVATSGDRKDRWKCPYCGSAEVVTSKSKVTAKGMVQKQMRCNHCGRYYSIAENVHSWYLAAKREEKANVES